MAIEARIRELDTRRESLDKAIHAEMQRPIFDETKVSTLKRQKLRLKEEADQLRARLN